MDSKIENSKSLIINQDIIRTWKLEELTQRDQKRPQGIALRGVNEASSQIKIHWKGSHCLNIIDCQAHRHHKASSTSARPSSSSISSSPSSSPATHCSFLEAHRNAPTVYQGPLCSTLCIGQQFHTNIFQRLGHWKHKIFRYSAPRE